jgi:hypothetical protein
MHDRTALCRPFLVLSQASEHLSPGGEIDCMDVINPGKSDDHPNFRKPTCENGSFDSRYEI